jgi:predicted RNA-binding Zn-ribbon protein involved in translation (DUF1610 family)
MSSKLEADMIAIWATDQAQAIATKAINTCTSCKATGGLVLSTSNADYSCEHCGQWQDAILNSAWMIVGYRERV